MPQLQITRAALALQHAAATTNYLLSVMLWPGFDLDEQRADFMRTCDAAQVIDQAKALPGTLRPEMLEQAWHAKPPAEFTDEITVRSQQGMLVGFFYAEMIPRHLAGATVSVKDMLGRMTAPEFRRLHPAADLGQRKLESLLNEYRPAATLLAAAYIRHHFPADLPIDHVAGFLALSEWVRVQAANIPLARRAETLLPSDRDLWRVPPYLTLPPVNVAMPAEVNAEWVQAFDRKRLPHAPVR